MNKGLFIFPIYTDVEAESSINKKNKGILHAFRRLHVSFDIVSCTRKGCFLNETLIYPYSANKYIRWFQNRHWQYVILAKKIDWKLYGFLWIRMGLLNACKLFFFKKIKKQSPVEIILEYGAFPFYKELKGAEFTGIPYDYLFRNRLQNYISYAITYCGQKEILKIPVIPIDNGIDIDSVPEISKNKISEDVFRIISVSTLQTWHGTDRIIKGIGALDRKDRKVKLNIVGWGPELDKLKKLVKELELDDAINFLGYVVGEELDEAFEMADMAAGTLAMHRINLTSASSLKNREYCTRGIPFFLSSPDNDFPDSLPFVKYIASGENAVDIREIMAFYDQLKTRDTGYIKQMQEYAKNNLGWESKIKTVLIALKWRDAD
jgi:glycosyltransferase involved in cell wall biosynthesis